MAKYKGVIFETKYKEYHSFKDLGLILSNVEISSPEAQTYYIDIPGMDGQLDLSEALTDGVQYKNRTIKLTFYIVGDMTEWFTIASKIQNILHGQKCKIIFDKDPSYYWIARIKVDTTHSKRTNIITMECTAEPYKYEINTGSDNDWLWDTFNFEKDVIREYKGLQVNGNLEVNVYGNRKTICPTFLASTDMQVKYNGNIYSIPANKETEILEIALTQGDNILTFIGTGILNITYKGGSL